MAAVGPKQPFDEIVMHTTLRAGVMEARVLLQIEDPSEKLVHGLNRLFPDALIEWH